MSSLEVRHALSRKSWNILDSNPSDSDIKLSDMCPMLGVRNRRSFARSERKRGREREEEEEILTCAFAGKVMTVR